MRPTYHLIFDLLMLSILVATLVLLFLGRTTTHEMISVATMLGVAALLMEQSRSKA